MSLRTMRTWRTRLLTTMVVAAALAACGEDDATVADPPTGPASETREDAPATTPGPASSSSSSSSGGTGTAASPAGQKALDAFWTTFLAGDLDALGGVQKDLVAARAAAPTDPALPLVLGMSYVWANAENARAMAPLAVSDMQTAARATLKELEDYTKLAPNEPRAWVHLGTAMVTIGGATNDTTMRDQGQALVLAKAMPVEKAEASFALAAAMAQAPLGSAGFDASIGYFFDAFEDCLGKKLDRDLPDFGGYDDHRTTARPKDVCFDQAHWPHAEEGNFLVFGDALVKANKIEAAKKAYAAALAVPDATTWKYRTVAASRLTEDLPKRMRSYRIPGATAAPVGAAPTNCVQCHQK